jgi:hypothetical protein
MLIYFEGLGVENVCILSSIGVICGYLVDFVVIWCIFYPFGMLHQEKSGNPEKPEKYSKFIRAAVFQTLS